LFLEGKDMFQGCCTLRIGFSKLQDLSVKQNGSRMWDYTVPETLNHSGNVLFSAPPTPGSLYPPQLNQISQLPATSAPAYIPAPNFGGGNGMESKSSFGPPSDPRGSVLLVNNLTPGQIDCDKLFTLFGCYGDVIRVKILFNKRDTALIQFATPQQAQTAQIHLNRLYLHSKEIGVNVSKHTEVAWPQKDDPESIALTKDYTGSPVHRFGHRGARSTKNINPPTQVLHISNIYEGATAEDLRKIFATETTNAAVQFFPSNRKMAYVKLDSIHEAVLALIRLHNYKFGNKYMRISFSHKDPNQVTQDSQSE